MATIDYTRKENNNGKSAVRCASVNIEPGDLAAGNSYVVFCLPKEAVIIGRTIETKVAGAGAIDVGFDGGSEIAAAAAVSAVGVDGANVYLSTGTGKNVTITPSGAEPNLKATVSVLFVEPNLRDGELMDFYTA